MHLPTEHRVFVEHRHESAALSAIKGLDPQAVREASGALMGVRRFAFVDTARYQNAETLSEAFHAWRWLTEQDEAGNVTNIEFLGEKLGNHGTLFEAVAPFVRAGSYVEMAHDDGIVWRGFFANGTVQEQRGRIVYDGHPAG